MIPGLLGFAQVNTEDLKWHIVEAPLKIDFNSIVSGIDGSVIISAKYLLILDENSWEVFNPQPPHLSSSELFLLTENKIWSTYTKFSSESDLYFFNGSEWVKTYNPLANQIYAMHFLPDGRGWVAGDRELAFFDGATWEMISSPEIYGGINTIFGTDRDSFRLIIGGRSVYHYSQGRWIKEFDAAVPSSVSLSRKTLLHRGSKLYKLENNTWQLISEDPLLVGQTAFSFLSDESIWSVGNNGSILHYNGKTWEKFTSPTGNNLTGIEMISEKEGWIVGRNGTLLKYKPVEVNNLTANTVAFNQVDIITISREINDEYGVAIEDMNGDGKPDVFAVSIFNSNRMYMNVSEQNSQGVITDVRFVDEAFERGVTGFQQDSEKDKSPALYLGVGAADIDNDFDQDLFFCDLSGTNDLFINNGSGYFFDVSPTHLNEAPNNDRTNSSVFGDVDNDGDLDLFITNEQASNRLYLNDGIGFFTDVTEAAGLISMGGGMCAAFADIDNDHDLDLCVTNWSDVNRLYRNDTERGIVKFIDISSEAGIEGEKYTKSNGVAFADIDNDGDMDLYIANRKTSNRFYLNNGDGKFADMTKTFFGLDSMISYGVTFADFDNDGWLDLYLANVGENILYKNVRGENFTNVTELWGVGLGGYSTGSAAGDIDNDGDIDLYVANYIDEASKLIINNINNNDFLIVDIEGTISNRDGVGTKIWVYESGHLNDDNYLKGYREINSGSGYASHNQTIAHFGLSNSKKYDLSICYPASGIKKTLTNIAAGQILKINEEEGIATLITLSQKALYRFLSHPETHKETIKFLIVLVCLIISFYWGTKKYEWNTTLHILLYGAILLVYWLQIIIFQDSGLLLSTILPVSSVIVAAVLIHLAYERFILVKQAKAERQAIRDKIARDLHDDLASTLSSSLIYNEALKHSLKSENKTVNELAAKISNLLTDASDAVTDIVWNVSPRHDKIDQLLLRLNTFLSEACRSNSIEFDINSDIENETILVPSEIRRNIYLIFKEAVNNIIKHSGTKKVHFTTSVKNKILRLVLRDEGIGICSEEILIDSEDQVEELKLTTDSRHGNGLRNILKRSSEIESSVLISSSPGKGTSIILEIKLA